MIQLNKSGLRRHKLLLNEQELLRVFSIFTLVSVASAISSFSLRLLLCSSFSPSLPNHFPNFLDNPLTHAHP